MNLTWSTLLKVDCCWNRQQTDNKVDCCRIRLTLLPVLATNRQQLEFDSLSRSTSLPICSTLLPMWSTLLRYGPLCCECVRGRSHTVDTVDFQQSRPCWIDLCRQCVPRFSRATLIIWLWLGRESISCWECIDYVITPLLNFVQKL